MAAKLSFIGHSFKSNFSYYRVLTNILYKEKKYENQKFEISIIPAAVTMFSLTSFAQSKPEI
jgi:hypothetical protein